MCHNHGDPEHGCSEWHDEITRKGPLSDAARQHLSDCADCREWRRVVDALAVAGTAFPETPSPRFTRAVLERVLIPPASVSPPPEPVPDGPWFLRWVRSLPFASGWALAVLLLVAVVSHHRGMELPTGSQTFQVRLGRTVVEEWPLGRGVRLGRGERMEITGPDGSKMEFVGPGSLALHQRGFNAQEGSLTVRVVPGSPYRGFTPHGVIEVVGTVFSCLVDSRRTDVAVREGMVRVLPAGSGTPTLLREGERLVMQSPPGPAGPVHEYPPPDEDSGR